MLYVLINDIIVLGDFMEINIGVSNRHVHLTNETWKELFGDEEIQVRNYISQPGQFASLSTVDVEFNGHVIEHVRVVGPIRKYNQIELSQTDANVLGINPPRRQSGDLECSLPINLIGPKGKVSLSEGCILAERHIHMTPDMMEELHFTNEQVVNMYDINHKLIFSSKIKRSDPGTLECHIDKDESQEYNLQTGDKLYIDVENR